MYPYSGASYAATSWREYPPEAHTPALQWPLLDELRYQHIRTDEWIKVDESMSKIQLAMDVAYLCNRFFEVRIIDHYHVLSDS